MKFILLFTFLSLLISLTNGITCIICSSVNTASCNDPFNSTGATLALISGYTYCQKIVFSNGQITRSGGSICSRSDIRGITTVYCCSDQDYCNNTSKLTSSFFQIALIIISFIFKHCFVLQ